MSNIAKCPTVVVRLITLLLFITSVLSGVLKRWDLFGISLAVLLIIVILECYRLLSLKFDERLNEIKSLFESVHGRSDHKQD